MDRAEATWAWDTTEIINFLIVGTGPNAAAVGGAVSNIELGANQAPVPAPSSYGPGSLLGNVPDLPGGILEVPTGVHNDGEVAITNATGTFDFANLGVYAETGIQCASTALACDQGASNSAFNQPEYPNAFPGEDGITTDFDPAFQLAPGNGVTGGVDFSVLNDQLAQARAFLTSTPEAQVLEHPDVTFGLVQWDANVDNSTTIAGTGGTSNQNLVLGGITTLSGDGITMTTQLNHGLNVIDLKTLNTGLDIESDVLLSGINWIINGFDDSQAVFVIDDEERLNIEQANVFAGIGLASYNSLLFASKNDDNGQHFNFNDTIINGVAFWSMLGGSDPQGENALADFGEITINNAQGCTQLIAAKINLNDTRFTRCAAGTATVIPLPAAAPLFGTALAILGFVNHRRRRQAAA